MLFSTAAIVKTLSRNTTNRVSVFKGLTLSERSAVFAELSPYLQQLILGSLSLKEAVDVLDYLDLRTAQGVLARVKDVKRRNKIITRLKSDIREKVEYFLRFHPKATLSLVHFNYLYLSAETTIREAGDAIEDHYQDTGKFPEILIHENGTLLGEVLLSTLVRERSSLVLRKFVKPVYTITYQAEVHEIIGKLTESERKKVIVLDNDNSVIGIIYADDALDLFGHMPVESLYDFTGVDSSERPLDSVRSKFSHRYRWLILNLATTFLAGSIILSFQDTIDKMIVLAVYIPIVLGMGSNAASQTFAVMLRGLTLGTVSLTNNSKIVIKNEMIAGLLNGLVIGGIVAFISIVLQGNPLLGLVVGLTMIAQHIIAAASGSFIPLFLKHLGKDPASTSIIFISTITDVSGVAILLALGTLILM